MEVAETPCSTSDSSVIAHDAPMSPTAVLDRFFSFALRLRHHPLELCTLQRCVLGNVRCDAVDAKSKCRDLSAHDNRLVANIAKAYRWKVDGGSIVRTAEQGRVAIPGGQSEVHRASALLTLQFGV